MEKFPGVSFLRLHTKPLCQFVTPLVAKHRRAHHQQAPSILADSQLRPNQSRFNGLAEPHLIGNQNATAGRVQKLKHRLELVRQEIGIRCIEAVNEVGQLAAQPGQRNSPSKM